jgi:hypothetical protein
MIDAYHPWMAETPHTCFSSVQGASRTLWSHASTGVDPRKDYDRVMRQFKKRQMAHEAPDVIDQLVDQRIKAPPALRSDSQTADSIRRMVETADTTADADPHVDRVGARAGAVDVASSVAEEKGDEPIDDPIDGMPDIFKTAVFASLGQVCVFHPTSQVGVSSTKALMLRTLVVLYRNWLERRRMARCFVSSKNPKTHVL